MMTHQTAMVLFVLGLTLILILPDHTTATDKFFQTGGRFGKRHDERVSDIRFIDTLKTRSGDKVPPRIERGFYISRYGKRNTNSITDSDYFNFCLTSYGMYCDFSGLPNLLRCKRIRPVECSNPNRADEKAQSKQQENDFVVNNNY